MFFRTIFELLITIILVIAARSLLGGVLRGLAGSQSPPPTSQTRSPGAQGDGPQLNGHLHRDPVCGTFVAETTRFQRQIGRQTVYYCSSDCREKHSYVAQ
jgi:YHS domain-containing protein